MVRRPRFLNRRTQNPEPEPLEPLELWNPGTLWEDPIMMAIVVILVILWLLGVITKYTLGGVLHILLVIAIIFLLINVIRGRGL